MQERGFRAEGVYDLTNYDSVSLFNGNLNISVPLGQKYPVSTSLSYQVMLRYAGNVWRYTERCDPWPGGSQGDTGCRTLAFAIPENGGLGWNVSFGELFNTNPDASLNPTTTGYRYTSPDGAEHFFYKTLHDGDAEDAGDLDGKAVSYTRDGTYLRMKVVSPTVRVIEFPDGQKQRYEDFAATDTWALTHIYNGFSTMGPSSVPSTSYVRFTYPASTTYSGVNDTIIEDSIGRTHSIRFKPKIGVTGTTRVASVDLAAFGGTRATYTFDYMKNATGGEDIVLMKPYRSSDSGTSGSNTATVSFLEKLTLPNGETFRFSYLIPTVADDASGTLQEMILPTLGKIEWDYASMNFAAETPYEQSVGVSARRLYDWNKAQAKYTLQQYTKYSGDGTGANTQSTMVGWTDDLGTNAAVDYKTIHHFVSIDTAWPSNIGLPFTTASRTGAVPNPDSAGRYLSTETLDCNPSTGVCTTERATYVKYERDDLDVCSVYGDPCKWDQNKRVVSEATLYVTDGGKVASVDYSSFDGLGNYRTRTTGGNFGVGDVRTTTIDYNLNTLNFNPSTWSGSSVGTYSVDASGNRLAGFTMLSANDAWVLSTYTGTRVTENGIAATAKACFDPQKNFLVRERLYKSGLAGSADLLTVYTADAHGNVAREESFGGDHQTISTAALCTMAPPAHSAYSFRTDHTYEHGALKTSQHKDTAGGTAGGLDFYVVDNDIDQSTALISAVRTASGSTAGTATAGFYTSYHFDALGRLTWIMPQAGHGAWTQYDYRQAANLNSGRAQVAVYRRPNGSTTGVLARNSIEYDGLGRIYRENELTADGWWNTKDTRYDHAGRKLKVSSTESWVSDTAQPSNWTSYTYDAFSRPVSITSADGKVTNFSYIGVRVVTKTVTVGSTYSAGNVLESSANTTEEYDRQGRLWKISEAANSTQLATTEYSYEIGGKLSKVCSSPSAGVCTQTRLFNYDRRGLLASEQQPERGLNGNGTVSYTYDARGNIVTKTEGASTANFSLTYAYDRAGRLTQVKETNRSLRLLKQMTYGSGNVALADGTTSYRNGKLATATRYNHDRYNIGGEVTVTETLTYGGVGGRVSRKMTDVANAGTQIASFDQRFTWNDLGAPLSSTYPDCVAPAGCAGSDPARTVTNTYTNGFLTAVPGYASSITYHPNGVVNTVTHGNGLKSIQTIASHQMPRTHTIAVQDPATLANLWQTDAYAYDGAANITKIGSNYYLYDKLGRLVEGTAEYVSSANHKLQRYTYDKFGNMTSMTTQVNGATTSTRTIGITTATNRLCSGTACPSSNILTPAYDDAGNVSGYGSESRAFDGANMLSTLFGTSAAFNYFYSADDERVWIQNFANNTNTWTIRNLEHKVLREYATTGAATAQSWSFSKDYVHRGGLLLASVAAGGAVTHFHLDHLGSTRLTTNASKGIVARTTFYPFGEEATSIVSGSPETKKFTGHERDYNGYTGVENADYLDYMHARYASPHLGRFLSVDPGRDSDPALPQSWNMYVYSRNNPVVRIDPNGKASLVYNRAHGYIALYNNERMLIGAWPAANNASSDSRGSKIWPAGTYEMLDRTSPHTHATGDTVDGQYGSRGIFRAEPFMDRGVLRTGMGVHAGRQNETDELGRSGVEHATQGCVRTTEEAMEIIEQTAEVDPLETITIEDKPVPPLTDLGIFGEFLLPVEFYY